ncbi:MAG: flagellar biosynthesis protein FlhB [Thermoguttaceae bacterium]
MADEGGEKQHDPTPRRREQAREEGQVARSQDLAAALILLIGIILLMTLGRQIADLLAKFTEHSLGDVVFLGQPEADGGLFMSVMAHCHGTLKQFLYPISIMFFIFAGGAVLVNVAQTGLLWLPNKLSIDFTKIDPMKGFERIFSFQSVMRLMMGIVKIIICASVAYYAVQSHITTIIGTTEMDDGQIANYIVWLILWTSLKVAVALVILAILDFAYQKWKYEQDLKMTTQQIRDEMKDTLGNPEVMQKRRQIQREMAKQRTSQSVPQADVVVTNPTHFAVALKFDPLTMSTPIVVAKGADHMAAQIRRIATEHKIPIIEQKPLAQSLFKTVEVGEQIREEHYVAVAEILRYVYEITGKKLPPQVAA